MGKWENGLGLPAKDSMEALKKLFDVENGAVATNSPEEVIVAKNRRLYIIGQAALWTFITALTVLAMILPFAIHEGSYGFTPEMTAGTYGDNDYIDTGDYRIYFFQFEGDLGDGRSWSMLQGWRSVRKHFWGCTVSEADYTYQVITKDNYVVGRIYSIKGKDGYYNLIQKAGIYNTPEQPGDPMIWDIQEELITARNVTIDGEIYALEQGFFFVTSEPVEYFKIGDIWYDVI